MVRVIRILSPTPALLSNGAAFGVSPVGGKTVVSICFAVMDGAASAGPTAMIASAAATAAASTRLPPRNASPERLLGYKGAHGPPGGAAPLCRAPPRAGAASPTRLNSGRARRRARAHGGDLQHLWP
ncbi:MAG: hypothetical protein OXU61_13635, partial [Gammaproteobacteria bacterium]|nr:hypothetical protein [Gammaproteobacteria bacterium]